MKGAVPSIYLFTWNLNGQMAAHDLAVDHLAKRGTTDLFVACFQELPGASWIAAARRTRQPELERRGISVVPSARLVPGLALAHHPNLPVMHTEHDPDDEFIAAVFRLSASERLGVVGLHAKSKVDMHEPQDHGGSRALLRHALNELRLACEKMVILGDFNSDLTAHEIRSWHCFYALAGNERPRPGSSMQQRRRFEHRPFYVVRPKNYDRLGTLRLDESSGARFHTVDFIAVDDEAVRSGAHSEILTTVSTDSVWDPEKEGPTLSDHLPVEGMIHL
jgi:exonuclease III